MPPSNLGPPQAPFPPRGNASFNQYFSSALLPEEGRRTTQESAGVLKGNPYSHFDIRHFVDSIDTEAEGQTDEQIKHRDLPGGAGAAEQRQGRYLLPDRLRNPYGEPRLPSGSFPVFRACKSDAFPTSVLIPSHDFYLLRYDATVLNASVHLAEDVPWATRLNSAYAEYNM